MPKQLFCATMRPGETHVKAHFYHRTLACAGWNHGLASSVRRSAPVSAENRLQRKVNQQGAQHV